MTKDLRCIAELAGRRCVLDAGHDGEHALIGGKLSSNPKFSEHDSPYVLMAQIERLTRDWDAVNAECVQFSEQLDGERREVERLRAALAEATTHHDILHPDCHGELMAAGIAPPDETAAGYSRAGSGSPAGSSHAPDTPAVRVTIDPKAYTIGSAVQPRPCPTGMHWLMPQTTCDCCAVKTAVAPCDHSYAINIAKQHGHDSIRCDCGVLITEIAPENGDEQ